MNGTQAHKGSGMLQVGLLFALGLCGALVFAIWQIGSEFLRTLALILVVATALSLVILASAFPIRSWRKRDNVGETHFVDGTRTIVKETKVLDGRTVEAPKFYQLPAQGQGAAFPELMRAAFQAGAIGARSTVTSPQMYSAYTEPDLPAVELTEDGWNGDITA